MLDVETRYLPLEKLALALVNVARKLGHYFQAHTIRVHPLQAILPKANLSRMMVKWAIKLGEHDIKIVPRSAIKGQVVADFIAEFTHKEELVQSEKKQGENSLGADGEWQLYVDGASNSQGPGAGKCSSHQKG